MKKFGTSQYYGKLLTKASGTICDRSQKDCLWKQTQET